MDTRASRCAIWKLHAPPSREAEINPNPQKGGYPAPDRVTFLTGPNRDFPNWRRQAGGCDRPELLVYFVMSASSAILNALPRHDVIARRAGTLPLCLTALRFPQFQIERLQKRLPHANAGGCFAYHPKPSFHADAQHGAPNVCRDGSVRDLNARQGM
jgi:hypothetical protein